LSLILFLMQNMSDICSLQNKSYRPVENER
jgi:hypothetical protein